MFKFRLEKVLRVRSIQEEQRKQEWALQERQAQRARAKLEHLFDHRQEIMQFGYGQADFLIRASMYNYLQVLDQKIGQQKQNVTEREQAAFQAKEVWFLARQEQEKITILRERHFNEHIQNKRRQEQKVLDDMRSHLQDA